MSDRLKRLGEEYINLMAVKKSLDTRLSDIASELKAGYAIGTHRVTNGTLTIQQKDRTTLDDSAFMDLCLQRNWNPLDFLVDEPPFDPDKIEQAYLDGDLTDSDLRAIRNPQYTTALIARGVEPNVQVVGESLG